jgi:molybdopterin synthase catalytic subunit
MIRVQAEEFDVGRELARLSAGDTGIGGICAFVGVVRDGTGGDAVTALTLEHYPGMTETQLARLEAAAHERWPLSATLIVHRYGRLQPGDGIVLVAVAARHRQASFDACQFLIDRLKTEAPFWKLEEGPARRGWVAPAAEDSAAADRWRQSPAR